MNHTMDNRREQWYFVGGIVVIILLSMLFLGRIEFHNELEQDRVSHILISYVDRAQTKGTINVKAEDWPQWAQVYDRPEETTVIFEQDGYLGIFADVIYYENRYERRTWFSGKVVEQASEYYYKPDGSLYLEAVYECEREPEMVLEQLRPQQYDFTTFKGEKR